jgi:hypothetical protein
LDFTSFSFTVINRFRPTGRQITTPHARKLSRKGTLRERGDEVQPAEKTSVVGADKLANEQLRTAINKLVNDAKAGKIAPAPRPQVQQRNNLSKGTKIAIGVGIAVAVIAIIVVAKADNGPTGPIRIF